MGNKILVSVVYDVHGRLPRQRDAVEGLFVVSADHNGKKITGQARSLDVALGIFFDKAFALGLSKNKKLYAISKTSVQLECPNPKV